MAGAAGRGGGVGREPQVRDPGGDARAHLEVERLARPHAQPRRVGRHRQRGPAIADDPPLAVVGPAGGAVARLIAVPDQIAVVPDGVEDAVASGQHLGEPLPACPHQAPCPVVGPAGRPVPRQVTVPVQLTAGGDAVDDAVALADHLAIVAKARPDHAPHAPLGPAEHTGVDRQLVPQQVPARRQPIDDVVAPGEDLPELPPPRSDLLPVAQERPAGVAVALQVPVPHQVPRLRHADDHPPAQRDQLGVAVPAVAHDPGGPAVGPAHVPVAGLVLEPEHLPGLVDRVDDALVAPEQEMEDHALVLLSHARAPRVTAPTLPSPSARPQQVQTRGRPDIPSLRFPGRRFVATIGAKDRPRSPF
jgi:hypothetical protein